MGLFSPKCPYCNGPLQATGYSAPYPTHRCRRCISVNQDKAKIQELTERLERLEDQNSAKGAEDEHPKTH